jgi:3-oxoacyl-[acyl-carrier protein] reductase
MANKTVLICGASSGIGAACAKRFAAEGYDVAVNARRADLLNELVKQFPAGDHLVCPGDYSDPAVTEQIQSTLRQRWGRLDVLVNSAGIFRTVDVIKAPLPEWRYCFETMTMGALNLSRLAADLIERDGRIIHVTSIHSHRAENLASSYSMAKAAIEQLSRSLALELGDRNILVNAIAPGFIETPMSIRPDGVSELETDWFVNNYIKGHHLPLRRAGQPEEVAGVALFLAGPDATYITGQTILVDGGLSITF